MNENYNGSFNENNQGNGQYAWQAPTEQPPYTPPVKKDRKIGIGAIIAVALCCSIIGATLGVGGTLFLSRNTSLFNKVSFINEGDRNNTVLDVNKIDTSKVMTPAEIYAANVNSTVGITTSVTTNYFGYQTTSAASGSGFILTNDGYIVTNHHVIEGANAIKVTTFSGQSYDATLIGYDQSNDLAVIKIEATDLKGVVLGDSDNMNVGDSVVAIGNPLGELTFSLTSGTVSALDREVTMSNGISMDLIQTDCAINSGNSGGALFNMYGEVIGITNAKYSSGNSSEASIDNIGFAIPMNNVKELIKSIVETGYIEKPYIGVSVADVGSENQNYGIPKGAAVRTVTEGGPAAKAGIKVNDIITKVNGNNISGSDDLKDIVADASAGDTLTLAVYRQGQTLEIKVTVEVQRQSALAGANANSNENQQGNDNQGSFFNPFEHFFG
ncbi:MAG: trypsin-like peptidase domain-containing protein [Clostridia bacterium]|nr:trypsin-like peptidase domain-containing protein [Clostridia bacterium]